MGLQVVWRVEVRAGRYDSDAFPVTTHSEHRKRRAFVGLGPSIATIASRSFSAEVPWRERFVAGAPADVRATFHSLDPNPSWHSCAESLSNIRSPDFLDVG